VSVGALHGAVHDLAPVGRPNRNLLHTRAESETRSRASRHIQMPDVWCAALGVNPWHCCLPTIRGKRRELERAFHFEPWNGLSMSVKPSDMTGTDYLASPDKHTVTRPDQ